MVRSFKFKTRMNPCIPESLLKTLANRIAELDLKHRDVPDSWLRAIMRGDAVLVVVDGEHRKIETWPVMKGWPK